MGQVLAVIKRLEGSRGRDRHSEGAVCHNSGVSVPVGTSGGPYVCAV